MTGKTIYQHLAVVKGLVSHRFINQPTNGKRTSMAIPSRKFRVSPRKTSAFSPQKPPKNGHVCSQIYRSQFSRPRLNPIMRSPPKKTVSLQYLCITRFRSEKTMFAVDPKLALAVESFGVVSIPGTARGFLTPEDAEICYSLMKIREK